MIYMARRKSAPKNLSDEARLAKNARIKAAMAETRARRASMDCRTFQIKIDASHLNHAQREAIARMFLEAKWLKNSCIANDRFDIGYLKELSGQVQVKTPTGLETREFRVLGGQLAQSVITELKANLKTLAALKAKGHKVGRLRFRRQVSCINFPQYGNSHKINRERNRIKLANIPGWLRVRGLQQLPAEAEFANAKLLDRPDGLFVRITCYTNKQEQDFQPATAVGLDMGVKTHLTLSSGVKINALVEESERARRLRRKLTRQVKGSNNWVKTKRLLDRVLAKQANQRNDIANKIVAELTRNEVIYFQDEPLKQWFKRDGNIRCGKRLQGSILGRVKAKLMAHPRAIMLNQNVPTTATCVCGKRTRHTPDKRTFVCPKCGYRADRDIHAAQNMIRLGQSLNVPTVERSRTLVDKPIRPVATMNLASVAAIGKVWVKQEAPTYASVGVVHSYRTVCLAATRRSAEQENPAG
ncbi:hypothetical protein HMPREF9306_01258 [Propionimicrobium lymphophilum ACS-093-V-SCH5]|uniref:Transposase n=1 Tax=Propionimicrobium lymphophilum ACS-093-V-SCH5 TaxID=883161 RepID=S2W0U9_9ACTN|nr:transposase [Propionimicrobium lymphophilum]EPD32736.1 hypothetical protein HMPREF9306_01258 [Propionimicrobium lymphophilum ACS-093-V-SCH5]